MTSFTITEQDRRAIRFQNNNHKTPCSRDEARAWVSGVVDRALADLRYHWDNPLFDATSNGSDPAGAADPAVAAAVAANAATA